MSSSLPIDEILPELDAALGRGVRRLVIEAPPGAGKTTRVPKRIAEHPSTKGLVVVSEPRRVAARLSAHYVARECGEALGERVGYRVRFDDKTSRNTQLAYVTEGRLLLDWMSEPRAAAGKHATIHPRTIDTLIFDEVHERSANLDVLLALSCGTSNEQGPRVVCMSATLETAALVEFLGPQTLVLRSEGRAHAVARHFLGQPDDRPLAIQVRSQVRRSRDQPGDTLVFLPGAPEIRACERALGEVEGLVVEVLHGDLSLEKQSQIVSRQDGPDRIVLSTNIAESSLTLRRVTKVIDSGLSRTAVFDSWAQVQRLETRPISRARAIQRAGRAGRVAPGSAWFLGTRGELERRPSQDVPELLRTDLSALWLPLLAHHARGGLAPSALRWLSPPSDAAIGQALELLEQLGALSAGMLTPMGELMGRLHLPPRLARTLVEGARRGTPAHACLAAALLAERDIRTPDWKASPGDVVAADSDLDERIELLRDLSSEGLDRASCRRWGVDWRAATQVVRVAENHYRALGNLDSKLWELIDDTPRAHPPARGLFRQLDAESGEVRTTQLLIPSWFDRVGRRRGRDQRVVLASGQQATLEPTSGVQEAELLLAIALDAPRGAASLPVIRMAARLDPDWLFDAPGERLIAEESWEFNADKGRLERTSRLRWGKVTIEESVDSPAPAPAHAPRWAEAVQRLGAAVFDPEDRLLVLRRRMLLFERHFPGEIDATLETADARVAWRDPEALQRAALLLAGLELQTLKDVREDDLSARLLGGWPYALVQRLDDGCPATVQLRGGLTVRVHYEEDGPPWIEARLQNFFSMTETPSLFRGRQPLSVHLLAPNHRPVQVTSDLGGFWERHYPELRKQLMRRYPKHLWPEDGRLARPPAPGRIR